ncbi:hypothetical protein [Methanoregula sp.]|uniref:hypothetical protein n=1 Tax=Methanoregula sp. TaxID=2052170 RepID=UPI002BB7FA8C|nr:hypothetical protein [Methanoregula sp.]HVP96130.1 hypothetical protein [Methanoregula sp.]
MNYRPLTGNPYRTACFALLIFALAVPCVSAITLTPGSPGSVATIAQGDPVTISGIATGHPQVGLQIWFIGYNFVKVTTVQVNDDNSYVYILREADTVNLAPGQYFVIVQHPMENGRFDIVYDSATGTVKNVQTGQTVFQLTGSGSLQSPDAANALLTAIGSQNIDDTFATVSFFVSQPIVGINSIGTIPQGTLFILNGTTSLAAGDNLMVEVTSSSFGPTAKTSSSGFSGTAGMVTVQPGSGGQNVWSCGVDTSTFTPDEYLVTVSGVTQSVTASAKFTVVPASSCNGSGEICPIPSLVSANSTTPAVTASQNSTVVPVITSPSAATTKLPSTTQGASLPAALCVAGITVAALLCCRRP